MKKLYFLIICLLTAGTSMAQKAQFGLKLGANFANQHATYQNLSANGSTLTSIYLGGFVNTGIGGNFSFQPEFLISSQGTQTNYNGNTIKFNTVNINIPLMIKVNATEGLNFEAGPQLGFLVSAKARNKGNSIDIADGYNTVDLGINAGVEYVFPSGFLLGLRYSHGITDILKDDEATTTNRVILLGIGYRF
ncbi:porin family protein [Solitalea canadensis]|uniref:Outer membrane protein beta-barrel domain-containing protein n=1 Tax=Solitalea canadensis (strain ATCC 29591 / DSM 3403 / JCM 21819 / LMG 8368 / NBRC 15130 / NCIMB 12057 / USAM 9D) TaxID=929556 RepID=H8KRQ6_SOLCM|nr:porin family protein [Solitalea canadensis]AFD07637.1 hypothetical protein Solca_2603 [Solitalea canadensis DSM 3403]